MTTNISQTAQAVRQEFQQSERNEHRANIQAEIEKVQGELDGMRKMKVFHEESSKIYDALVALRDNEDFKLVILEDYMKDFALSQVYSRVDARLTPAQQSNVDNAVIGVSAFNEYLTVTAAKGRGSKDFLEAFPANEQQLLSAIAELHKEMANF